MSDESMVDRVAVAISGAPFPTARSRAKARVAIAAMREPTKAMMDAKAHVFGGYQGLIDWAADYIDAELVWASAIDAALSEKAEP